MSAKWRAFQHRHRYTYSAVIFPSSFVVSLSQSSLSQCFPRLYADIMELISQNSIYAQVNHAKNVAASFGDILTESHENAGQRGSVSVSEAIRFYLETLFLENSLPLNRTLVSALAKIRKFHSSISSSFRELCDEYGGLRDTGKRFCVPRVALSVMGYIVFGLEGSLSEIEVWVRPPPNVMEQCQEALSCLYYLLQRFPTKFKGTAGEDANLMERVLAVLISILKSMAFSRDCFVAAGVSLCAALQVCLSDDELGSFIDEGVFYQAACNLGSSGDVRFKDVISKVSFVGDFSSEIQSFSSLSRLCMVRGTLTAVSRGILNS